MLDCDFSEILKINQIVKTQASNDFSWINNKIISINKDIVQLHFKDEYLKILLTIGDSFKIKVIYKRKRYILIGFVENVVPGKPNNIFVRIENAIEYDNTRKYSRCGINLFCRIEPSTEEFRIHGITTDISEGGISMVTYADFNIVEPVNIEIVTNKNEIINFIGKIQRMASKLNNHIQYGIEIIEMDEKNKKLLNKLITASKK